MISFIEILLNNHYFKKRPQASQFAVKNNTEKMVDATEDIFLVYTFRANSIHNVRGGTKRNKKKKNPKDKKIVKPHLR